MVMNMWGRDGIDVHMERGHIPEVYTSMAIYHGMEDISEKNILDSYITTYIVAYNPFSIPFPNHIQLCFRSPQQHNN